MVMGPTHAMSGAAIGLAMAATLPPEWGGPTSIAGAFVFAGVTAGAALLPDLDSPQATIARSFGPASQVLAHVTENAARAVYSATRTKRDSRKENGHRTATHTILFAVLAGLATGGLVAAFGMTASVGILFVMLGLALRGLFPRWAKKNGWLIVTGASAILAWGTWRLLPESASAIALGASVTVGVLAHLLGDVITKRGVPMLAPLVKISGKRWYDVRPPEILRIRASGPFDKLLLTACTVAVVVLTYLIVFDPARIGVAWA
ncbi:metal-dependent hydrolase [Tomitella biformata]|uniref:metal-dependent hydrolase n=1 Tax=Tomitella biformata TaxID=630403 RepID=UPI000464BACA|nr:metal-dependent hydrolase [Tomitella biformata]